jgi:hypothetical protein
MPSVDLITAADLHTFKQELLKEISTLLKTNKPQEQQWLRSRDIKKLLGISSGTLQTMRINGTLPFTKLNGSLFYSYSDVMEALNKNKSNG